MGGNDFQKVTCVGVRNRGGDGSSLQIRWERAVPTPKFMEGVLNESPFRHFMPIGIYTSQKTQQLQGVYSLSS